MENCYNTGSATAGWNSCGGVAGINNGSITNCYYLKDCAVAGSGKKVQNGVGASSASKTTADVAGQTIVKTAEQFKSGEVAYLLNGSTSEGTDESPLVWFQTCDEGTPALTGETVYCHEGCDGNAIYANTATIKRNNHVYQEGFCRCGEYEPATLKNGVYEIGNAGQLYWFAGLVNGTLDGVAQNNKANAKLTKNITVNPGTFDKDGNYTPGENETSGTTPHEWTPIGDSSTNNYSGTFDGCGFTVSGLYFNNTDASFGGLVGYLNGTVQNVGVIDSYIKAKSNVGGVTGRNGSGMVKNCYNSSTVVGTGDYTGGVVGYNYSGRIEKCYNTGAVGGNRWVGGVVGLNQNILTDSYNTGAVTGSNSAVGGIVGTNQKTLSYCYNIGSVKGNSNYVGGVCGNNKGTINACFYFENCAENGMNVGQNGVGTGTRDDSAEDTEGATTVKTAKQFESGEVAYLLNGEKSTDDVTWKQTLSGDKADTEPKFTGATVYSYTDCAEKTLYANEQKDNGVHEAFDDDGFCKGCGNAYEPAVKNASGVYEIKNAGQLYWFAGLVNGTLDGIKKDESANAVLVNDIKVNSDVLDTDAADLRAWVLIDSYAGNFNGNGHTISGLYYFAEDMDFAALFLTIEKKGTVSGVTLKDSYFCANGPAAGIAAINKGTIERCANYASVTANVENTIVGSMVYAGGVVADNSGVIENCYNFGEINSQNVKNVGGIAGKNSGIVRNSYNIGMVYGDLKNNIGAVVGNNNGTVENCYYFKDTSSSGIGSGSDEATAVTQSQLTSGEITYKLNGKKSVGTDENPLAWYQTIDGTSYPSFTGEIVYYGYERCNDTLKYANSELLDMPHEYSNGICKNCKGNEPAELKNGYYEIDNLGKLLWFANYVNTVDATASAKLTADIDATSVSAIGIGKADSTPFVGTFDGNGKKLTVKLSSSSEYLAVFPYINGATIENLTLDGEVNASNHFAGSIVGKVCGGTTTLQNCLSLVTINSSYDGDGTHGGLISIVGGGTTTINNCGFAGKMIGTKTTSCGGIVGWTDKSAKTNISNSYVAAQFNLEGNSGNTFGRNPNYVSLDNCYYLNALSDASVATQMSSESFASGEVAYLLNGKSSTGDWKQTIGSDAYPNFTSTQSVYPYTNCVGTTLYTNDSAKESGLHDYNDNGLCKLDSTHYQPAVLNNGVYEIGNLGQLMWFASKVNSQEITNHAAKLTANITIDNSVVWTPISLKDNCDSSFEGGNNTITFANTKEGSTFGLFGSYNYSTISNLYLKGSIVCNQSGLLGALVNSGYRTTVNNVISTVSITNSGDASTGGLFGRLGGKNTRAMIQNCAVYADVKSAGRAGGLVGENWGGTQHCYIYNSAYKGDVSGSTAGAIMGYNGLQTKCKSYFTSVYYCEKDGLGLCGGTYGGTITQTNVAEVTESQFESGEVAYLLNNSSSNGVWKQTIGTDTVPNFTGGTVYRGYNQCDETIRYSNSPLRNTAHDFDEDGFCTAIAGETHYLPATLNNNGTADDTTDDYYEISKPGQLFWFAEFVNKGGDNTKANAVLMANIDLKGREFTPIGLYSDDSAISKNNAAFSGTFDGKYHVIYNLNVNMTENYEAGLFSRVSGGATLKNFGVINATVKQNGNGNENKGVRSGIIAGEIYRATVENVFTAGELVLETKHDQAGGLAGECKESTLTNCYTTLAILTDGRTGNTPTSVTNCYYMADKANANSAGENKTAEQFVSGEVAYLLQTATGDTLVWGQTSSEDGATPILTSNEDYRVLPVKSGDAIVNYSVLKKGETNDDGQIDITDYQNLVNIALSDNNEKVFADKYDINGDGVLDVEDCTVAQKNGMSVSDYNELLEKVEDFEGVCYMKNADFDNDGVVDVIDIALIERMLSGNRVIVK